MTRVKGTPQAKLAEALELMRVRNNDAHSTGQATKALRPLLEQSSAWRVVAERVVDMPRADLERLCLSAAQRASVVGNLSSRLRGVEGFRNALIDLVASDGHFTLERDFAVALAKEPPTLAGIVSALRAVRDQQRTAADAKIIHFSGSTDAHIDELAARVWDESSAVGANDPRACIVAATRGERLGRVMWMSLAATTPTVNRVAWLDQSTADVTGASAAQRVWGGSDFSRERVNDLLLAGVRNRGVGWHTEARESFDAKDRAVYAARMRDVNNVLFTGVCVDLAERAQDVALSPASDPNRGPVLLGYDQHAPLVEVRRQLERPHIEDALSNADGALKRADMCIGLVPESTPFADDDPHLFDGEYYVRAPIGAYGAELSVALIEAARLVMPLATEIADGAPHDVKAVVGETTVTKDMSKTIAEGVASTSAAIALLLANKLAPPYDNVDAALGLIDRSGLVAQLSALAPFGLLGPMAATGVVPRHAIDVVRHKDGRDVGRIPADFEAVMDTSRDLLKQAMTEAREPGDPRPRGLPVDVFAVTARGCPVAGRGPLRGADGNVELSPDAGLTILTHAMIQLTRKVLRERIA